MICPKCNYAMDAFSTECPRCHGKGIEPAPDRVASNVPQAPAMATPEPKADNPAALIVYFIVCGILPPAGFIFGLVYAGTKPQRAMVCFAGALIGTAAGYFMMNA